MFKARLGVWLGVLVALVATQFAVVVWLVNQSELERSRSLRAKDALVQYIDLAANKQRLKVWFAQYLLTDEAPVPLRDGYLQRMQGSLSELERLHAEEAADPSASAIEKVSRETLDALHTNFQALQAQILQAQPHIPHPNPSTERAAVWDEMLGVFDISQGQDMRTLIKEAIRLQEAHSRATEAAAKIALERSRSLAIFSILSTILLSIGFVAYFAWDIRRRMAPLLDGTLALQAGRMDHRIATAAHGRDEFDRLSLSFNRMAEEIQLHRANEASQRQRLEDAVAQRTQALHEANEQLLEIDRSRRQFFANISHELRTPTTAILGESEITLRRSGHPEAFYRETLERVAAIARQLGARIAELMAVARQSEDKAIKAKPESLELIALPALLQQALAQQSAAATQQGHQLSLALPGDGLRLRGSAAKLGQALTILIDNAIRYTPAQGQIRIGAQRSDEDAQQLHIWVEDSGIGMAPQDLPRATERYWRSDAARKLRPDGMGLGLPIAEGIAESHGGHLQISCRPEGGCRVLLSLPLAANEPDEKKS
ncbi:signal transduction histidine kinase [Paucibacter oligotrophus]|uniref:histidine kinase n=1 Tax=Roseateles oligotrophus TaxID=1769250 RepID=A0A840LAH1_9BURK|nr:HAMP domain-containing sensor histidine kinase [Roseateles oligotrophus]MBB4843723.1 signal transduction histidine kinase [Roseateles oligotrophus]